MGYTLTFVIHPEAEAVSIGLFLRTIEDITRLLRDVDYAVTRERSSRRWVISKLHSSSPTITLRPVLDNVEIAKPLVDGLRTIAAGTLEPPTYFTEPALDDLKRMRRLFTGGDKARSIEFRSDGDIPAIIERGIDEKAERILRGGYWNLGSLEGALEAVNFHGNPTFTIWDRVSRAPVRCGFPEDAVWKERVKSLLEKKVLVVGRVNYFRNGIPRSVTNIARIEDMTADSNLPKAAFGSIPTSEIAEDPAGFLRMVREKRR